MRVWNKYLLIHIEPTDSGKSTTLKCLIGILQPTLGSVEIEVPNCDIESVIYGSNFCKYKHTLYSIYAIISI
ncbi:hypothetical protein [Clostridium sulfidigenes]|uniref:hypothetical protein n=1 Tax=Clostridium sulfidigenes TaxID=318464 RepID=UPI003F88D2BC